MKTLYDLLGEIDDFRRAQGQRFTLQAFLEMVILAGMSGHFGINSISRFIANNQDYFIERYGFNHGVPKKTVIFNILSVIDYSALNEVLVSWASQYIAVKGDPWFSLDGKAIGSTLVNKHGSEQNYQSIVSLFSKEMGLVLNSRPLENKKANEGQVVRDLIGQLELKGVTFTLDPLHCQKKPLRSSWLQEMTM